MFTLVQNYKKIVLSFIRNDFVGSPDLSSSVIEDKNNSGYTVDELIKQSIDDGRIDKKELFDIKAKYEEEINLIGTETKKKIDTFIIDLETEMLKDGMSVEGKSGLDKIITMFKDLNYNVSLSPSLKSKIDSGVNLNTFNIDGTFDGKNLIIGFENKGFASMNNDYINNSELIQKGYHNSSTSFLESSINEDMRVEAEKVEAETVSKTDQLQKNEQDETISDIIDDLVNQVAPDSTPADIDTQVNSASIEHFKEKIYTVKPGDTLFKIVREQYEEMDNSKIAKMVNYIVDQQESGPMAKRLGKDTKPDGLKDGIKGDNLWVGDKIKLPVINPNNLVDIQKSAIKVEKVSEKVPEKGLENIKVMPSLDYEEIRMALKEFTKVREPDDDTISPNYEIGEYTLYDENNKKVKSNTITLKQSMGNIYVELDGTRFWDDLDNTIDLKSNEDSEFGNLESKLQELIDIYQTEVNNNKKEEVKDLEERKKEEDKQRNYDMFGEDY